MQFIVNNELVETKKSPGTTLLSFLRDSKGLTGTKIGCQEGDCGACNVIMGSLDSADGQLQYHTVVSCLTPLANCQGKHVVTIEGINQPQLNLIQKAILESSASQCGFCTPGIVVSLMGYLLDKRLYRKKPMLSALDGNICRCTGYKSIERAVNRIITTLKQEHVLGDIESLVRYGIIPKYFSGIWRKLQLIKIQEEMSISEIPSTLFVGGATDIMLQHQNKLHEESTQFTLKDELRNSIQIEEGECILDARTSVESLYTSDLLNTEFPALCENLHLFASTPVRNMATVAGNIANASPIGDLTIILLALGATLLLEKNGIKRQVALDEFFLSYKRTCLSAGEQIAEVRFKIPPRNALLSFEKVSKRKILDIASVNMACLCISLDNGLKTFRISCGGVAPIPLFLSDTSDILSEKILDERTLLLAMSTIDKEIRPIDDIRGSAIYKRLLARQLLLAHLKNIVHEQYIYNAINHL